MGKQESFWQWEDRQRIEAAWNAFENNADADIPNIRLEILESWRRSKRFGVDPYKTEKIVLHPEQLKERIRKNQAFYDVAVPYAESMHQLDMKSGFMALICDADGYVLKLVGSDAALESARQEKLVEGAARGEPFIGTNAVGTCIHLKKPLHIWANEHYYKPHSIWSCSAAPVFDSHGTFIGVFCLSGLWDKVTYHTLGMVAFVAETITKQLALQQSLDHITKINKRLDNVVELMSYGIVFLDQDGAITQINSLAMLLLNVKKAEKDSIIGHNIREYIQAEQFEFTDFLHRAESEETFSVNTELGPLHCASILLPPEHREDRVEAVLTLRKAEYVHKEVNRIVGSSARFTIDDIIGRSPAIMEAKKLVRIAAPYLSNVLLSGESGTGKELFAQAIHNSSSRAKAPFLAINCGALPRSLIESELFGYEGGTFTGSKREGQAGKFELANGGTIFLDEIGDMPYDVQVNLLRVLQSREVVRIGGKRSIPIDVRIISATNKNLEEGICNHHFREDLYYRLNVFPIKIPPLRERTGDVRLLCDYMLMKYDMKFQKNLVGFTPETYRLLEEYNWPGNIRELENIVERSVLISTGPYVKPTDLPPELLRQRSYQQGARESAPILSKAQSEENAIRSALEFNKGNIRKAAIDLRLSRGTLYNKIHKYGIDIQAIR